MIINNKKKIVIYDRFSNCYKMEDNILNVEFIKGYLNSLLLCDLSKKVLEANIYLDSLEKFCLTCEALKKCHLKINIVFKEDLDTSKISSDEKYVSCINKLGDNVKVLFVNNACKKYIKKAK